MDGQQVYVTGADGEQMVLSGPEAAALLEQAGINIHDNGQVLGGVDGNVEGAGVEGALLSDAGEPGEGEGIVQIPEGSSIQEDGSIIAADGSLLAPPGSVIQGEDGSLIMTQDASLMMQGLVGAAPDPTSQLDGGADNIQDATDNNIYATPDGRFVTASGQVVNAEGQLTGEMIGQVLDTTGANSHIQDPETGSVQVEAGKEPVMPDETEEIPGQIVPDGPSDTQPQSPIESEPMKIDTSESEPSAVTEPSSVTTEPSSIENVAAVSSASGHISEAANVAVSSGTGGQMVYTTADGSIVSAPEGAIMTNSDGNLITADGRLLTNADGTPVSLAAADANQLLEGAVSSSEPENMASLAAPADGGIMVSAAGGTIMTATGRESSVLPPGLLTSEEGVIAAPEGSIITEDGSLVSADGIVLAPPGSILTEQQQAKQQQLEEEQQLEQQQQQQQQQSHLPSGNLIGLQLPDENGEVLYLDPNDPAAQILLQEAGITLGEGGVLKTADGQILTNEEGNPITSNLRPATAPAATPTTPAPRNNLVGDAVAAAGLGAEELGSGFQLNTSAVTSAGPTSMADLSTITGQSQASMTSGVSSGVQQTKYQKLTFSGNSPSLASTVAPSPSFTSTPGLNSSGLNSPRMIQRKTVQKPVKRSSEVNIGPDQQKVTYTVTSENGYSQTYMMICSKSLDQNTLINTLIKNISNDPNHKGKKTIKITQHKYGPKKTQQQTNQQQQHQPQTPQTPQQQFRQTPSVSPTKTIYSRNYVQQQQTPKSISTPIQRNIQPQPATPVHQPSTPVQETIMPVDDTPLTLEDFVDQLGDTINNGEAKVIVRCNYCTSFRSVLNSQTWENILNHILPVAREELHTAFYGNILRNFSRGLKIQVLGRTKEICEVNVSHGLVCRRTGAWYQVHKPSIQLAIQLATHIAAVQPGVSGPYGARPRGNSIICLFCSSPYTADDYQKHLSPHLGQIYPCLLLIAGAYCSNSFETEIKKLMQCESCDEGEHQDLRFLPCSKFAAEYSCTKKLQATVESFRENFDSRGFLQVSNSAMTKCSVCRNQSPTYCALFKITNPILVQNGPNEMLAVCSNCQKQFVNIVMRENAFDKQLKMFQLHHMEQLCGVLRVLLSVSQKICNGQYNVLYTVQEGGSLYSANNTIHKVLPARLLHLGNNTPARGGVILEENKAIDMSGPSIRFVCEQCKFSIDLTRLEHKQAKSETHLVEMALGVVLEHIVPHTDSLLSVITTAAKNEMLDLKFEFNAAVEGEGTNRKITVSLDRKILPTGVTAEVSIQKDICKTIEIIKSKLTPDKRGNIKLLNRYVYLDQPQPETLPDQQAQIETSIDMSRFLDKAKSTLSLYGSAGCNTRLLDYYSECKLCSKFSFPDFRLTAGMQPRADAAVLATTTTTLNSSGVAANNSGGGANSTAAGSAANASSSPITSGIALCENCCETILSLCVPSEPERLMGRGDSCLLLGVDKNSGHRLVLSNQAKKWISADGVEAIKTISDVAALSTISDYSSLLIQKFRSYLMAVCSRTWSDPDCVTARAGFIVKPPVPGQNPPIEVKVTLRPPKSKTPMTVGLGRSVGMTSSGGRLKITPVPVGRGRGGMTPTISRISSTGRGVIRGSTPIRGVNQVRSIPMNNRSLQNSTPRPSPNQKLVKITANRRIIPVRDPTSMSSPIHSISTPSSTTLSLTSTPVAASSTSTPTSSKIMSSTSKYSQQKIDAMREALRASSKVAGNEVKAGTTISMSAAKVSTALAAAKTSSTAGVSAGGAIVVEDDTDFETLEDIANFINSSEPEPGSVESSNSAKQTQNQNEEVFSDLQDEFTNNALKLSSSAQSTQKQETVDGPVQQNNLQLQTYKLPKGTIVANLTESGEVSTTCSTEVPIPKSLTEEGEGVGVDSLPVRIPSTLRISEVDSGIIKLPELTKSLEAEAATTPSPANDATTSTRSTAAPGSTVTRKPDPQHTELSQEMESLSSLNLDLVDSLDLDLEELEGMSDKDLDALDANSPEKKRMNISKILSGSPAPRKLVDSSTKLKRKREDEDPNKSKKRQSYASPEIKAQLICDVCDVEFKQGAAFTRHMLIHRGPLPFHCNMCGRSFPDKVSFKQHAKIHMNGQDTDDDEIIDVDNEAEAPDYMKGLSQSGRVRKAKKMFDL